MQLSRDEESALKGEYGETIASAYRILLAIGEADRSKKTSSYKMGPCIRHKLQYYW